MASFKRSDTQAHGGLSQRSHLANDGLYEAFEHYCALSGQDRDDFLAVMERERADIIDALRELIRQDVEAGPLAREPTQQARDAQAAIEQTGGRPAAVPEGPSGADSPSFAAVLPIHRQRGDRTRRDGDHPSGVGQSHGAVARDEGHPRAIGSCDARAGSDPAREVSRKKPRSPASWTTRESCPSTSWGSTSKGRSSSR